MVKEAKKTNEERRNHVIDAEGQVLGRLATQVAVLLRGKHKVDFVPYKDMGDFVTIFNTNKIKVTGKKMDQKIYWRHTGYLGNTKFKKLRIAFEEDSGELLRRVVFGMLPKNKLRSRMIKKLKVHKNTIK